MGHPWDHGDPCPECGEGIRVASNPSIYVGDRVNCPACGWKARNMATG